MPCRLPTNTTGSSAPRLYLLQRDVNNSCATRAMIDVTSVISAVMTWRMMSNLRGLVNQNDETS
ncbi:hypothetical protein [Gordonia sp. N1V]|uniref:hypothetical protein n=1 Tax=Gordonia sp. N1V TaxID=3034163 RepID=UPI0023E2945A|nr:hypothetical protein [Gordonia sp. N1V]MDF3284640.1 hypothetical protein [Gordonia sp. N1V]